MSAMALQKALEKVLRQPQQKVPTPDSDQQKDDAPAVREETCQEEPVGAAQKARHVATTADHMKPASSLPNAHQKRRTTRADLAKQCLTEQHAAGLQGTQVLQQGRKRRTCMHAADAAAAGAPAQSNAKRLATLKYGDASAAAAAAVPKAAAGKKQVVAVLRGMSKAAEGAAASSKHARAAGTADSPSAHKRVESTAYPNIKSRGDGKFQVFLCSQGLKYLHVGQFDNLGEAKKARDLAVLAVHGAQLMATIHPAETYSDEEIAAVRLQMSQRPASKAVMEANGLWPPKGKGSSKPKAGGQHTAPLSKRFAGLQHQLPSISKGARPQPAAAGSTKGCAAAAAGKRADVLRKGTLAPVAMPLKRGGAKPAKGSGKQQPLLLPVAARGQQPAAAAGAKVKPATAGSTQAAAAAQRSPSALRVSRRAAAAGVFAAVVAAGGGSKTPPSHHADNQTAAATSAQDADMAATIAAVAAVLRRPKQMKSNAQPAAAASRELRNKASAAVAAAARARAKAAPVSRASAAAAPHSSSLLPRLTAGMGSEHHARATQNPTGTTGIREHKGVFEVFLGTPPFRYLYVGRANSLAEANKMKHVALLAIYGSQVPAQQLSMDISDISDEEIVDMAVRLAGKGPAWEAMQLFGTAALVPGHLQPQAKEAVRATAARPGAGRCAGVGRPTRSCVAQRQQEQAAEAVVGASLQQQQQRPSQPPQQLAEQQQRESRDPRLKHALQHKQQQLLQADCSMSGLQTKKHEQQPSKAQKVSSGGSGASATACADGATAAESRAAAAATTSHSTATNSPAAAGGAAVIAAAVADVLGAKSARTGRACRAAAAAGVAAVAQALASDEFDSDSSEDNAREADAAGDDASDDEWDADEDCSEGRPGLKARHSRHQQQQQAGRGAGCRGSAETTCAATAAAACTAAGILAGLIADQDAFAQVTAAANSSQGARASPAQAATSRPLPSLCDRLQAFAQRVQCRDKPAAGAAPVAAATASGEAQQGAGASFDVDDLDPAAAVDALDKALASLDCIAKGGKAPAAPQSGPTGVPVVAAAAAAAGGLAAGDKVGPIAARPRGCKLMPGSVRLGPAGRTPMLAGSAGASADAATKLVSEAASAAGVSTAGRSAPAAGVRVTGKSAAAAAAASKPTGSAAAAAGGASAGRAKAAQQASAQSVANASVLMLLAQQHRQQQQQAILLQQQQLLRLQALRVQAQQQEQPKQPPPPAVQQQVQQLVQVQLVSGLQKLMQQQAQQRQSQQPVQQQQMQLRVVQVTCPVVVCQPVLAQQQQRLVVAAQPSLQQQLVLLAQQQQQQQAKRLLLPAGMRQPNQVPAQAVQQPRQQVSAAAPAVAGGQSSSAAATVPAAAPAAAAAQQGQLSSAPGHPSATAAQQRPQVPVKVPHGAAGVLGKPPAAAPAAPVTTATAIAGNQQARGATSATAPTPSPGSSAATPAAAAAAAADGVKLAAVPAVADASSTKSQLARLKLISPLRAALLAGLMSGVKSSKAAAAAPAANPGTSALAGSSGASASAQQPAAASGSASSPGPVCAMGAAADSVGTKLQTADAGAAAPVAPKAVTVVPGVAQQGAGADTVAAVAGAAYQAVKVGGKRGSPDNSAHTSDCDTATGAGSDSPVTADELHTRGDGQHAAECVAVTSAGAAANAQTGSDVTAVQAQKRTCMGISSLQFANAKPASPAGVAGAAAT